MNKIYCSKCNSEQEVRTVAKEEEYEVRGEKISIKSKVYVCNSCNEEIFDEKQDNENLEMLYSKYREKYGLLTPQEIRDIREKYGLSQRAMSRLFAWGEITINRYENGSIQDAVHNEVLELVKNPENMLSIFEKNKYSLSKKEREKLEKKLNDILSYKKSSSELFSLCEAYLTANKSIDEFTGFKPFDLQKIKNLILYIAQTSNNIMKTKLNKLLFFIDFLFFKTFSVSLTGSRYVKLQFGPIPDNYDWIIELMTKEDLLEKREVVYSTKDRIVGEELSTKTSIDKSVFDTDEFRVIDFCLKEFEKFNCIQISEYSHKEEAYRKTEEKQYISYSLAKDLSLSLM